MAFNTTTVVLVEFDAPKPTIVAFLDFLQLNRITGYRGLHVSPFQFNALFEPDEIPKLQPFLDKHKIARN
jgi:hypothetical protein